MPWCENPTCRKSGLSKNDVEFDEERRQVLCHCCYVLAHPGWMPPIEVLPAREIPKLGYVLQLSEADGFRAKLSYGGTSVTFHAPAEDLRKLME